MKNHSDEVSGRSLEAVDQVSSDTIGHIVGNSALGFVGISLNEVISEVNVND